MATKLYTMVFLRGKRAGREFDRPPTLLQVICILRSTAMKGAFGILLLAAAAPLLCRGAVDLCRDVDGFVFPPVNER